MKVHRNLRIVGSPEALVALLNDLETSLTNGWQRDRDQEAHLEPLTGQKSYCFTCDRRGDREEGSLHLFPHDKNSLEVTNIVPSQKGSLSYDEYNQILEDFHSGFVGPLASKHGVQVELSGANVGITEWVSEETAEKLHTFSACANKSTGSSHPMDQTRWYAFLVAAHREGSNLTEESLRRWLQEEEGWDEDHAWKLSIEYETARSLLKYYDNERYA